MTRAELLDWLAIDDSQLDRLLARGLPAEGHGQYSMNDVADWLNANGLAETVVPETALPPGTVRTRREAAAALSRSVVTIDQWIAAGCPGEPGRYVIRDMQRWRDDRDRELKRPATYGSPRPLPVSEADLDELRAIVLRGIRDETNAHAYAVAEAIDNVLKLGPTLPADEDERRALLATAIPGPFFPWITTEDVLQAKIESRMADVLEPWGLVAK